MPSSRRVVLVALAAAIAGMGASLLLQPAPAPRLASEAGQRALDAALKEAAPEPPAGVIVAHVGDIVPAMRLTTPGGARVDVPDEWAGRPHLVNLWATWCAPCLKEMPELQAYSRKQGANGVQVAGIALDDPAAVRAFLRAYAITYPSLVDAPGPGDAGVRLGNPAGVLPYSVLVSAQGRILKTRIGPFASQADIAAWASSP